MSDNLHAEKHSPNRLRNEKSPYLLQHAENPVDWYPWGEEAFRKAKTENKPIFLSIGYSSCHWCHVMAHESFEDETVASFLNQNFVSIKVDREERPDVDEIYMKAVMSMTGAGGWPLSVFLTPSLEPFFGGTYFPSTPRYGMPSFMNLIKDISRSWKSERKNLVDSATQMRRGLKEMYDISKNPNLSVSDSVLHECYGELASSFDENHGGFGQSPKFPMPTNLLFLMRYSRLKPDSIAISMVTKTLDSMMRGGIFDQVGGGFHRYSTDRYWTVPHFEKMLYDNALLTLAYSEGFLISKNKEYSRIVTETLNWLLRELRSPEGGFYSAQDADSSEGEGSYYVWDREQFEIATKGEIEKPEIILEYFSITATGNFENGKSILTAKPLSTFAKHRRLTEDDLERTIQLAKKVLLDRRNMRPRPTTDDKILTSWNGLAISALCKGYSISGNKEYLDSAISATEFVLSNLAMLGEGKLKLFHSYRERESSVNGFLEDYSFLLNGLIDLYEASFEPRYLEVAVTLCESMISKFHDKEGGGFYMTEDNAKNLIVRPKDAYDGAIPSGNSMAALACSKLAEFTMRDDFRAVANDVFETFWSELSIRPSSFSEMLVALQFFLGAKREIVVSGEYGSNDTMELLKVLRSQFLPDSILVFADERIRQVSPLAQDRIAKAGEGARVYVCSNFTCKLPVASPEQVLEALRN